MPIDRLLESKLGPDEIAKLNAAFRVALRSLSLVDRNDPLSELIAKQIIRVGANGVRDPAEIAYIAVRELGLLRDA